MDQKLRIPDEPLTTRAEIWRQLTHSPSNGLASLDDGEWIVETLWPSWEEPLLRAGLDRDTFRAIVLSYRNEIRLWAMGERPWSHCIEGLIGRVERRARTAAR